MSNQDRDESDAVPLPSALKIDALCKEFENAWQAGRKPRIEEFLVRVEDGLRHFALHELIAQEVDLRQRQGEHVDASDYHRRFADAEGAVKVAFAIIAEREQTADPTAPRPVRKTGKTPLPAKIGRYVVERVLGQGGFAVVYLAKDPVLERLVAIKVSRLSNADEIDRYLREARSAAKLKHAGLVTVYDVGGEGDQAFIVQEYVPGQTLAQRINSGPVSWEEVVQWLIEISDAVAFAHRAGLVHRDLKPANILLDEAGHAHVADFGLAVHESIQRRLRGDRSGTTKYMSPEQVRGESHRLDGAVTSGVSASVLYLLLTRRDPFSGDNNDELHDEILHREVKPLRQIDPAISPELERICLKCLCKRVTQRYSTASDLTQELRGWLATENRSTHASAAEPARVVPKGLRAYGSEDADFFLTLLPGPCDRQGLPEIVRFWKNRIEERDGDNTFAVGVIYGPSGCGKSSLVRAGILPHLGPQVVPIYVEASAQDTEVRLLKSLRKVCPGIPEEFLPDDDLPTQAAGGMPQIFCGLREGLWTPPGKKLLIVLDQFEQWLHAHQSESETQLVSALRHCSGAGLQCLLLVRDDFWTSITRVMQQLDIPLVERENSVALDVFDQDHVRKVLFAFGRAFGKLPECEPAADQQMFINAAVDGLARAGKVMPVRLALFVEMIKGKPWSIHTLKQIGGTEGVGVTFLEETFHSPTAPPTHRLHEEAARAVLECFLPEGDATIRGGIKSYKQLFEASGYADRPDAFDTVLNILDREVRLITPAEPDRSYTDQDSPEPHAHRFYQLTHDFLVKPIHDWITQKRRETRQGRATLCLAETAAHWDRRKDHRHLPSWIEWLQILTFAKRNRWTPVQRQMMTSATRYYVTRVMAAGGLVLALAVALLAGYRSLVEKNRARG